jgi:hypothetical protein
MNRIELSVITVIAVCAIGSATAAIAQSFERIPYSAPPDWTVTTYRSKETGAFLRCSAERHYDDGNALTVARTAEGKSVLGFTSSAWAFDDRETTEVRLQVDANMPMSTTGRGRLLPSGPMLFVDVDPASGVMAELSNGSLLLVTSGETTLRLSLRGSAAAIAGVNQCRIDGANQQA